jgi:hypothetical protein
MTPTTPFKVTRNAIIVDASDPVASRRFFEAVFPKREAEPIKHVRRMVSQGRADEAVTYLASCNRINQAFGWPEYQWPADLKPKKSRAA